MANPTPTHYFDLCDMTAAGMRYVTTLNITNTMVNYLRHEGLVLFVA